MSAPADVVFKTGGDVPEPALFQDSAGYPVLGADPVVGLHDHLQVGLVAKPELEIDGRKGPGVDHGVGSRLLVVVAAVAQEIALDLKMPGINRVGGLGLVRTVGGQLPHEIGGCRIEEMVGALVRSSLGSGGWKWADGEKGRAQTEETGLLEGYSHG